MQEGTPDPDPLQARLAAARARLTEVACGGPLCRAGDGAALKEAEGRVAALRAAQRAIGAGGGPGQQRELLESWRSDAQGRLGAAGAGWRAYLNAGIEELEWAVRQASPDRPMTGFAP